MTMAEARGQEAALATLERAVASGRVSHAYLFTGPEGVGKEAVAQRFAQGLLCSDAPRATGCGTCPSCRKVAGGSHPDLHTLAAEKDTIPIDAVRTLTARLQMTAFEGGAKVAIARDTHKMNAASQNALLKTLEEPPGNAVLILCTHAPHLLLPTVRSRCQRVAFGPLRRAVVRSWLATACARSEDDADVRLAAALGEGSFGRARQILEEGRYVERGALLDAVVKLRPEAAVEALELAQRFGGDRVVASDALEILQIWFRDQVLATVGGDAIEPCLPDSPSLGRAPLDSVLSTLDVLHECRAAILGNASPQLTMERALFAVARCIARGAA
jgi:DNA polymerase-3 subunit delta'